MSQNLSAFDPAAWQTGGVITPVPRPKGAARRERSRSSEIVIAASVALSIATAVVEPISALVFPREAIGASRHVDAAAPFATVASADEADPAEWGKLVTLFSRLPRTLNREDDLPEPLV